MIGRMTRIAARLEDAIGILMTTNRSDSAFLSRVEAKLDELLGWHRGREAQMAHDPRAQQLPPIDCLSEYRRGRTDCEKARKQVVGNSFRDGYAQGLEKNIQQVPTVQFVAEIERRYLRDHEEKKR